MNIKIILTIIAIVLSIIGYGGYIVKTLKKEILPHSYSWGLWALLSLLVFFLQKEDGGGIGSYVSLAVAIMCIGIFIASIYHGYRKITLIDNISLGVACISIFFWLVVDQPVISIILLTLVDAVSFIPTIRKSLKEPKTESSDTYIMNGVRHTLLLLALENYSIVTVLFPVVWVILNLGFGLFLIIKNKKIN